MNSLHAVKPLDISLLRLINQQILELKFTTAKEAVGWMRAELDEFIISYKDRTASLPLENHIKAVSNNGIFKPIIIINGKVRKPPVKTPLLLPKYPVIMKV